MTEQSAPLPPTPAPPSAPPVSHYRVAIRRPVTMIMIFLTVLVFGYNSYKKLPINLMPDISYPTLTVRTEYEGAAPADVEKLLTRPLEETLSIVSGMVEISSVSSPGMSEIMLEFAWGTDMNVAQQDVRDRLDLFDPPKEVTEKPVILRYDPTLDPVMRVAITGENLGNTGDETQRSERSLRQLTEIREAAERHVKNDLEAEAGIAQVLVKGGREREIQIRVDSTKLKNLGLTLDVVNSALAQQNVNLSGGRLREGKTEYLVRTKNEWESVKEIEATLIPNAKGEPIRLKDVADVIEGEKERDTIVHINGQESVALEIYKEGDANTVQVCNKLKDVLGFDRELGFVERLMKNAAAAKAVRQGTAGKKEEDRQSELARTVQSHLPKKATLTLISDQSRFIIGSIKEVQSATIVGGLLALGVLYLFLHDLKSTLIIGISIPISVVATFVPMFARGISLNIMSLGGLALGVGMLVDNSIVVLESIFRCKEEGDGVVESAERGAREVGAAVTSSTLTTVAVFFPISFVEGVAGQLFGDLALTVTFSLLASLVVALYLIPMIASRQRFDLQASTQTFWVLRGYRASRENGRGVARAILEILPRGFVYAAQWLRNMLLTTAGPTARALVYPSGTWWQRILHRLNGLISLPMVVLLLPFQAVLKLLSAIVILAFFILGVVTLLITRVVRRILGVILWLPLWLFDLGFNGFRRAYGIMLDRSLRFSAVIILIMMGLAVHAGMLMVGLGRELIPPLKQGEFGIRMEAPPGTRIEETERRAIQIEEVLRQNPDVESVTVDIGTERTKAKGNRGENIAEFTILLKNPQAVAIRQDAIISELREKVNQITSDKTTFTLPTMFSFKTAVEVQIRGDELTQLRSVGENALEAIRTVSGVKDAELSIKEGYPEVIIELDREILAQRNLSPLSVAQRIRNEVQGEVATRFSTAGEKIDVRVRTDQKGLQSLDDLRNLSIIESYPPLPLSSVAKTIDIKNGPSEIRRVDQRQVVLITANVEGMDLGAVSTAIMDKLSTIQKPEDYVFLLGGQNRELDVAYRSLKFAAWLAIFLVYVVMACQFESLLHPAIVMFSVPLAFIGVGYALVWTNTNLSIMVFIGGIILVGIVVNNAIVLVDYVNQLRERGMSKREALVLAGQVRLRPIFMTTITTVLGLLPMVWNTGEGAEMRRPMAITVMSGLSSSTLLTLVIIPMVYYLFGGRDKASE